MDRDTVSQAFSPRQQEFEDVGLLEVGGLGFWMGKVDEAGDGRGVFGMEGDVEEGEVFRRLGGMPLHSAKGVLRPDDPIAERGNADIERASMVAAEIKAKRVEERLLHPQRAAGKARVAIEARGDAVAGDDDGGNHTELGCLSLKCPEPQRGVRMNGSTFAGLASCVLETLDTPSEHRLPEEQW